MKALILGKGLVGTGLANFLPNNEVNVTHYSKKDLDYTMDPFELSKHIQYKYDVVINASGYTGKPNVDACESDKQNCWYYNVVVPTNISRACSIAKTFLIHISSGCIYNGYEKIFTEKDIPNFGLYNEESSYYSKSKHAAETMLANSKDFLFRIRIPFTNRDTDRNIINKILSYDNLISMQNSMTSLEDFNLFVYKFMKSLDSRKPGVYNVVNEGSMEAREMVEIMNGVGLMNPNHKFINLSELNTVANRSNCVLSTEKIKEIGLGLPEVKMAMKSAIMRIAGMREPVDLYPAC